MIMIMKSYKLNYNTSISVALRRDDYLFFNNRMTFLFYNKASTRYTNNWALIKQSKGGILNSPYKLAMKYLKNGKPITALEVNNVLSFLDITITQDLLNEILSIPRIEFTDLDKDTIKSEVFLQSVGTIRDMRCSAGVYIWTHIATGDMYVGSSTSLPRRLIGYFKGTHADVGKIIPLLKSEGLPAFTLQVIPLTEKYYDSLELSIEQYFLLQPEFNLNTLRVVNLISGSRSKALFMYTKDFSELIYSSENQEDFIFNLRIHHSIFTESLKTGAVYLGKYIFTDEPIQGAKERNMTTEDLLTMLEKDRLEEKVGRKVIIRSENDKNDIKVFNSIKDCLTFLNTIGSFNKTTLYRYIKSGKPYHGFICEWGSEEMTKLVDRGIEVAVTNVLTGKTEVYSTTRKAALSFPPEIKTTGQTVKTYASNGKLFKGKYLIEFYNN